MPGRQTHAINQGDMWGQSMSIPPTYAGTTDLWCNWDFERRSSKTINDLNGWVCLWPRPSIQGATPGDGMMQMGQDSASANGYEPASCLWHGNQNIKFILGTCLDNSSAAVANAIVQCFRTSDDLFTGQVTANTDGTYTVPTPYPSPTQHYLVAYKAGSPDIAGTTVNTLTATNVDGS